MECHNLSDYRNSVKNCFPAQNVTEFGCWLLKWRTSTILNWIFKMFIFGNLAVTEFQMCSSVPNFITIWWFSSRYGDLSICNVGDIGHFEFSKFRVYVMWPLSSCYSASLCKISLKSDNLLLSFLMIFKMAAVCHLEF